MALHSDKDVRRYLRELMDKGWVHVGSKRHTKMRSPGGRLLSLSNSPSDPHALAAIKRDVKKIEESE